MSSSYAGISLEVIFRETTQERYAGKGILTHEGPAILARTDAAYGSSPFQ
jgi:hypothetical protein